MRDWKAYVGEMIRVTKPGGLLVFVDASGNIGPLTVPTDQKALDRGFPLWGSLVAK